jgi:hypothetical protein
MIIAWGSFVEVVVASLVAACLLVALFSPSSPSASS